MTDAIRIDVWSDIACPWCYIGKRNLEKGIATAEAGPVEVVLRSYQLAPDGPVDFEGDELEFLATHEGVPREQAQAMLDRVTKAAEAAGLEYHFELLQHTNTHAAHQLLQFAKEKGRQLELGERLMAAYFTEGRHLGREDELVALAVEAGLDGDEARAALREGAYARRVQADIMRAAGLGIQGVPFFVFDNKYGVSGAQAPDAFAQVIARVRAERDAASPQAATDAISGSSGSAR
ncbi:DsbA family oxidoreductase [Microbacterium sp. No. 7]|uniref:DsbA family oxidoreductase n=1 Tax=Microbacterium sp. No. 7 TaxID=1714373 RepID=UPI0006D2C9EC|nr:DsbA family oxidoreductase [Microbacterium sp. No. 7]ALJ20491.1 disulfide bond formation protein DsbA [Microbacterium sp. No. 7]